MNDQPREFDDLLDRYLDHSSSLNDERRLFDALSADPALRSEFIAAVNVQGTITKELDTLVLPEDLYEEIAEHAMSAGVFVPIATSTSTTVSTGIVLTGVALAIAVAGMLTSSDLKRPQTTLSEMATSSEMAKERKSEMANSSEVVQPQATSSEFLRPIATSSEFLRPVATSSEILRPVANSSEQLVQPEFSHSIDDNPIQLQELEQPSYTDHVYDVRLVNQPMSGWGSGGIEMAYQIAPSHQVGVTMRRTDVEMQKLTALHDTVDVTQFVWFGALYRFQPEMELPLGMQPYAQLTLGGGTTAAMIETAVGVSLPIDRFSIGVGADFTNMFVQNAGSIDASQRFGLRLNVGLTLNSFTPTTR